jgi:outer membrane protein assembly factor BamB
MSRLFTRSYLLIASFAFVFSGTGTAQNWDAFRGSTGDGHAKATGLPVNWSETENVVWKTPINGKAWSSPVVWDDQIWLTNATPDGKALSVVCVDRKTGKITKDIKLFELDKPPFCHPFNSYASSTPAIEKGRLYAHFGTNGTACVDTETGKVLWDRRDLHCDHFRGAGSSPVVHGDLLFLIFDGVDVQYVVALDKNTGKTVWKKDREIVYPASKDGDDRKGYATPAIFTIDGKPQLVCPAAGATIAYEPATGKEIWRVLHPTMNAASRPILANNLIYVTVGHKPTLLAIRPGGTGDITNSHVQWKQGRSVPSRPGILVIGDLLFMVSDNGIVSCLDAKTGTQVWEERLGGECTSSALFADGHIYLMDQSGNSFVIEPTRTFKKVASNRLPDGCMASPIAVGKSLLIRTKTHLYCFEKP